MSPYEWDTTHVELVEAGKRLVPLGRLLVVEFVGAAVLLRGG